MIIDFTYHNPTKIIFGKNSLDKLEDELKNFGDKILFTYGGGSLKRMVFTTR
jgi:alcohol dehydrogenase YqhD (iron-dependent ADH family)